MPTLNDLIDGDAQRLDTGFTFTEGPLYHPDGFYYFVDVRESKFYRIKPGEKAELLRENTGEGNGTTFDPQGRLIQCEGGNRRVTRWPADGTFASSDVLMDRFDGKRLSRPNDVVCKSDGSVYFTNPGLRIPLGERLSAGVECAAVLGDGSRGDPGGIISGITVREAATPGWTVMRARNPGESATVALPVTKMPKVGVALAAIVVVTVDAGVARQAPVVGLVWHNLALTGKLAVPVLALAVIDAATPTVGAAGSMGI